MPTVVGSLRAELSANVAQFAQDMGRAGGVVDKFAASFAARAKQIQAAGRTLALAVTAPIALFGVSAVKAFAEAEGAAKAVDAVLSTMGQTAGFTAKQLGDIAKALEASTAIDADDILGKVTANLLTFGNVQGRVFERAQEAALDLSIRLGQDLQSSAIQLGKALNDPIKGITALSRVGVSFTASQKETIKALAETGRVAEAQDLILRELEKQYGQVAEVAAQTADGGIRTLAIQFENLQEQVGAILVQFLPPLIEAMAEISGWFEKLTPETKEWIVQISLIAAAVGPVLIVVGAMAGAFKNLAWIATTLVLPALTLIVRHPLIAGAMAIGAAIGYIADNFDDLTAAITGAENAAAGSSFMANVLDKVRDAAGGDIQVTAYKGGLAGEAKRIEAGLQTDKPVFGEKPRESMAEFRRGLKGAASEAKETARALESLRDDAKDAQRAVMDFGGSGLDPLADRLREIDERYSDLKGNIQAAIDDAKAAGANDAAALGVLAKSLVDLEAAHKRVTAAATEQFNIENRIAELDFAAQARGLEQNITDALDATGTDTRTGEGEAVRQAELELAAAREDGARQMLELEAARADASARNDAAQVARYDALISLQGELADILNATTGEQLVAAQRVRDAWGDFATDLADSLADMIVDWKFDLDGLRDIFGDIAKKLFLKPFLESATGGISDFLGGLFGAGGSLWGGGKAAGGPVYSGMSYLVGEDGPELFSPGRSGRITPNDETAGMVAGGRKGTVVNQYISTPNADSFRKSSRQIAGDAKRSINFA